jgi:hypothetical protein
VQWSDAIKPPSTKMLREFAGLWLVFFLAVAALRWYRGHHDQWTLAIAVLAVVVGGTGLLLPRLMRPIYTGWMIVVFPIGWTVSRVVLAGMFFLMITPMAWLFRLTGRDVLQRRRHPRTTYWMTKRRPSSSAEYFRQS